MSAEELNYAELALRRMIATDGTCGAAIWLFHNPSSEWCRWETCNSAPGHEGNHQAWSDRDSDVWAEWTDDDMLKSPYVSLSDKPYRLTPSPWSDSELLAYVAALEVGGDSV